MVNETGRTFSPKAQVYGPDYDNQTGTDKILKQYFPNSKSVSNTNITFNPTEVDPI